MKTAYENQRRRAKHRGIGWNFTYESWLQWWVDSGKISLRGNTKEKPYKMCRFGDMGDYSPDNVYCGTNKDSFADLTSRGVHFGGRGGKREKDSKYYRDVNRESKKKEIERRIAVLSKYDLSKPPLEWSPMAAEELGITRNAIEKFTKKMGLR